MSTSVSSRSTAPAHWVRRRSRLSQWPTPRGRDGHVWAVERWLVRRLLDSLGGPPVALVLWNGESLGYAAAQVPGESSTTVRRSGAWCPILTSTSATPISDGRLTVEGDLLEFLELVYRCEDARPRPGLVAAWPIVCGSTSSTRSAGSRSNIHHHYDIGDDFYRLWLDRAMVYTCAYFPTPDASLEDAQTAKLDLVCRKLWLQPGETVVEAGCGWGALALHMARHYGVTVKAYNVSREQIRTARERAKAEGLDGRVEFIDDDYRAIRGQFDVFASVGMLEHVGHGTTIAWAT